MAQPYFDGTTVLIIGIIVVISIAFYNLFGKKKQGFKDFRPVLFEDTVSKELRKKLNLYGKKIKKGKIIIGFNVIAHIDRYYETKGEMPIVTYDEDKGSFDFTENPEGEKATVEYDFTLFRLKNKFFLIRWLGLKKSYMIMRNTDKDGKELVKFDDKTNRFFFPKGTEFDSYGNIYNESPDAKEYLNNISFLEMLQQTQTHLQNIPDRTVHLEIEQAKKERLAQKYYDLESAKYEKIKKGDETTVS